MKNKFYVVKKGRNPGIYRTYEECQKQVEGYSGAEFRGFTKETEAMTYLGIDDHVHGHLGKKYQTDAVAYVDGSFNISNGLYGSGMVIFHNGTEQHFYQAGCGPELVPMRNVAGEIQAAQMSVDYCLTNGIRSLTIYYDYMGVFLWAIGKWKTNKKATEQYKNYMSDAKKHLFIHFEKVTAHSGNYYNDIADQLAKKAVGLL